MRVLVSGATGFVGKRVVQDLLAAGHAVYAGSREGRPVSGATPLRLDVTDPSSAQAAVNAAQPEAVVHLVGIIREKGTQTFERVHHQGTKNLLEAASKLRPRWLQMSALGAREGTSSGYFTSKAQAEGRVKTSGLEYTIFQPSLIFGEGDDFFGNVLKNLVSVGPFVPVIGDGLFPFRPVWVGDVSRCFVAALEKPESIAKTYLVTGPKEYTFKQLLTLELAALGRRKPLIHVPLWAMNLAVPLMQILPNPPITKDQYAMLLGGNSGDPAPARDTFGLHMERLEDWLPRILGVSPSSAGGRVSG